MLLRHGGQAPQFIFAFHDPNLSEDCYKHIGAMMATYI